MVVDASGLRDRGLDLELAGDGVRLGHGGAGLGRFETPLGEAERVPPQTRAATEEDRGDESEQEGQRPAGGADQPEQVARAHGKAFRSSSKCGPSRRRVQSPPQTMGVPCRAAAALKAAAIRG